MTANTLSDSLTMFRRDLRHMQRYPVMTISSMSLPTFMLLLFVYVFGGAIGASTPAPGGVEYIDYVMPGILVMAIGGGGASTAINITTDMNEGVITRFRTMRVSRASVLTGQVIGSFVRTALALTVVIGVALALGFRPNATPVEWLGVVGMLAALTLAVTWLTVAAGLFAKTPEGANSLAIPLIFVLPFISSTFVPTDSMASGLAWFAERQPFTPIIDTLRGLLLGTPIGNDAVIGLAWCAVLAAIGFALSLRAFARRPAR